MEAVREMDAATKEERGKTTATAGPEATAETIGVQATEKQLRWRTATVTMEAPYHHRTIHRSPKHKSFQQRKLLLDTQR